VIVFGACIALIVLAAADVFWRTPALERNREQVIHAVAVVQASRELEREVAMAERAQRGYLITDDRAYLKSYDAAVQGTPALLARLKQLVAEDPAQQRRVQGLERQVEARLAGLRETLEIRQRDGMEAARHGPQVAAGAQAMAAIEESIGAMVAAENALLSQRMEGAAAGLRGQTVATSTAAVLAIVALVFGLWLARYATSRFILVDRERRESEAVFRHLVEGVSDYAIFMLDPQGRVATWNRGAERIKGYTAGEIIGKPFSVFYTPQDQEAGVPARALETAEREGRYVAEGWRVRKDGSRFFASVAINAIRDRSGELSGFAKITRDYTERLEQQQALDKARTQLAQAQKMEALGRMSGGIAHDFNNLLHVISNGLGVLERSIRGADVPTLRILEMIRRSVESGTTMIQRLLAFSRHQPLEPSVVEPNKLVADMRALLSHAVGGNVSQETVLGGGVWPVSVDPNQLELAILNLAANARDAMPKGGKLTLETSNAFLDEAYAASHQDVAVGQYVMIAVSDTGTGMPPDVVARAFEPFFTTKAEGEGTGLGLSQVYGFIKQSGGHVAIYSEPGQGTTVKLYLPRSQSPASRPPPPIAPRAEDATGKTILVVDDHVDALLLAAQTLRDLGYTVLEANDASAALEMLEREPRVDLLFTDVALGDGMNGRELAREITKRRPGINVLFTTAFTRNAIIHHGRLDPDVELLAKPFSQSDLANKVRRILGAPSKE
jgi:PAS domain S-box-containing protein